MRARTIRWDVGCSWQPLLSSSNACTLGLRRSWSEPSPKTTPALAGMHVPKELEFPVSLEFGLSRSRPGNSFRAPWSIFVGFSVLTRRSRRLLAVSQCCGSFPGPCRARVNLRAHCLALRRPEQPRLRFVGRLTTCDGLPVPLRFFARSGTDGSKWLCSQALSLESCPCSSVKMEISLCARPHRNGPRSNNHRRRMYDQRPWSWLSHMSTNRGNLRRRARILA